MSDTIQNKQAPPSKPQSPESQGFFGSFFSMLMDIPLGIVDTIKEVGLGVGEMIGGSVVEAVTSPISFAKGLANIILPDSTPSKA